MVPFIAKGIQTRPFEEVAAMTINLAILGRWEELDANGDGLDLMKGRHQITHIFASFDLPELCKSLLQMCEFELENTALCVHISSLIGNDHTYKDGPPCGRSDLERLLEPFRILQGLRSVHIHGLEQTVYKTEIVAVMCGRGPTPEETVGSAWMAALKGLEAFQVGEHRSAILKYKTGLNIIFGNKLGGDNSELILSGPVKDFTIRGARKDITVRLHERIAAAYLELQLFRMACIYTERVLAPIRSFDRGHWKMRNSYKIEPDESAYAEVFAVTSQISFAHGNFWGAVWNLREAARFGPLQAEDARRLTNYTQNRDLIEARRVSQKKAQELQTYKQNMRLKDKLCTAWRWTDKGDVYFHDSQFLAARSKYEAALSKAETTYKSPPEYSHIWYTIDEGRFQDCTLHDVCMTLILQLLASLAATCARLSKYANAVRWTESVLEIHQKYDNPMIYYPYRRKGLVEQTEFNQARIHQHRGLLLKSAGQILEAIKETTLAQAYAPGDFPILSQLTKLQRQLQVETAEQENSGKKRLREERIHRKESQEARMIEARRTKGQGFFVGLKAT